MGLFKRLFRNPNYTNSKNWMELLLNLSKGLEECRELWFKACLNEIKEKSNITVQKTHLEGHIDFATKGYQLFLVSLFLGMHKYLPSNNIREFIERLSAQVCGTELEECLEYLIKYSTVTEDYKAQMKTFSNDIEKFLTDTSDNKLEEIISNTGPLLWEATHIVVADNFDDEKTADECQEWLKQKGYL